MAATMDGSSPLILHIGADRFILEDPASNEVLVIDRLTQEIDIKSRSTSLPLGDSTRQNVYGIIGIIKLIAGPYLMVITERDKVGEIQGHSIYRIKATAIHSFKRTTTHLSDKQSQSNRQYVQLLEAALATPGLYFSYTYDLTHSAQRLALSSPDFKTLSLFERADQRFLWNLHVLQELASQRELHRYCLPLVCGFIEVQRSVIKGSTFEYILISRRSPLRAGTRFFMRGVDSEGQVANYVETEQIVECGGNICSFMQTRGSIPLFWSQRPNLKYKPKMAIAEEDHLRSLERHFDSQVLMYGPQIIINLVNGTGGEGRLQETFANNVSLSKRDVLKYIFFDFHHECRKMRWHRLTLLLDQVAEMQTNMGYYHTSGTGVVRQQHGVFRTNCIDCLDRTNVVQSLLARRSLQTQLQTLGVLEEGQFVEDQTQFESLFRNVWADNADALSKQYAGTGALKTDFTRTGKRTLMGALNDGVNSAHRYFINNFTDGFRQDAIDLFVGNYVVEETEDLTSGCPLRQDRDWKYYSLPLIFLFSLAMCLLSVLLTEELTNSDLLFAMMWFSTTIGSAFFMVYFGDDFVDKPKLAQAKYKLE